jgi:hypothetical protein
MTAVFQRARNILLYPPGLVERAAPPPRLDQAGGAMVLNQPALSKAIGQAVVAKMIHVYKAPVAEDEMGPIVDYWRASNPPIERASRPWMTFGRLACRFQSSRQMPTGSA